MAIEPKDGTAILKRLEITNNSGSHIQDLSPIYAELNYFESMLNPTVSVNITLRDGSNIKDTLPIVGGEVLRYAFSDTYEDARGHEAVISNGSPYKVAENPNHKTLNVSDAKSSHGISPEEKRPMRVYKLQGRARERDRLESYALSCVTGDFLHSSYKKVEKAYRGTALEIVEQLLEGYFGLAYSADRGYDFTNGQISHTFVRETPIGAIRKIASEAEAKGNTDSNYYFWQTNSGYKFRNLQSLISAKSTRKYMYVTGNTEADKKIEGSKILSLTEPVSFSSLDGILGGQYGVNVKYYDPIAKSMFENKFSHHDTYYPPKWRSKKRPTHALLPENISKEFSKDQSLEKYLVSNYVSAHNSYCTERDYEIRNQPVRKQNFLAKSTAVHNQFLTGAIEILVYGNSSIQAGDLIDIDVPSTGESASASDNLMDKLSSGKYLIVSLRHSVTPDSYYTALTITKDSYLKYPVLDDTDDFGDL